MGEMMTEPSMEEILSSIKRIIAEEGDGPGRGRRLNRPDPAGPREPDPDPEVLELHDSIEAAEPQDALEAEPERNRPIDPDVDLVPEAEPLPPAPVVVPAEQAEPILSPAAAEATRGPLEALSRVAAHPEPSGDGALESVVREMLRPMLRQWLDANLPAMVEKMVSAEIARITARPR